jgi:lipoprotein-releasing system permease protein
MLVQGGRATALDIHHLSTGRFVGVELVGIDVEGELETTELRESLARESRFGLGQVEDPRDPFSAPPGWAGFEPWDWVVVGEQLARQHDLYRGAEINIGTMIPDPVTGEVHQSNRKFLVAGTFRSRENEVDLGRIYLDRRQLADFLGGERSFSQVLVKLKDYPRDSQRFVEDARLALAAKRLIRGDPYEVRTWEQYRGNILGAIENEKTLMGIMLSLVLIVAGFTVFAILSMMVTEKRRDIGILTALGATPRGILGLFLMIGFWDALIGALLGAIFGVWAALEIDNIEQWLSATFGWQIFNRDVYLFDHIPTVVEPTGVALIVLGAFSCTLVFAAIPAWRAARMHPLDALRYE